MADEVRRSGRATKGQHTKNDTPEPAAQKKGKGRGKKAQKQESEEPEEEEAIIRCVCGYTVEDKRDKRAMVCCDSCEAWQHNVHMGLSEDDDDLPDQYFCEQCRPEDHKELLEAMEKGEKIWETREQAAKAAKAANRKRGKGGRKSAAVKEEAAIESRASSARAPSQEVKTETGQKRKLPPESPATNQGNQDATSSKKRRSSMVVSTSAARRSSTKGEPTPTSARSQHGTPLQLEKVEMISELRDSNRKNAATALSRLFTSCGDAAAKEGKFKVPEGIELSTFAQQLAVNVEYAMFLMLWGREETPKPEYGMQMRQILHNVKHNDDLRNRLLNEEIQPNDLATMSSTDMASKELLEKAAAMKKKAEQQSILPQNTDPVIRRTHKGEEVIENPNTDYDGSSAGFRRPRRINTDNTEGNGNGSEGGSPDSSRGVELPADVNKARSPADISKLSLDTRRRSSAADGRKSSATFDVDKVWSSVESPGTPSRPAPSHQRSGSNAAVQPKPDPEIDQLLKDENEDDEEYSPADYSDPEIIWGGGITMATVTEFRATAKYAAGANLSAAYPWNQLMPELLSIEGRIDINDANTYLCGLQYSKTNDVTVVSVTPADHQEDKESFTKLFEYLTARKRYGVIRKSPIEQARDIYVIPLEAGTGGTPEFLELLADTALPTERKSRTLLVAYVIKCTPPKLEAVDETNSSSGLQIQHTGNQPSGQAAGNVQRTPSAPNSQMSPIVPPPASQQFSPPPAQPNVPANPYATPSVPHQGFAAQPHGQIPQNPYATQSTPSQTNRSSVSKNTIPSTGGGGLIGMAAAITILGDMANSPAITQLLQNSPNVGVNEMGHVKDVFLEAPETRASLDALLPRLQQKIAQSPGNRS